jgi:peptide/nickel transport system permease protein
MGGGAILTETVFDLGGVGQYAAQAIDDLDQPAVLAVTMLAAFFVVLFNTLVEIAQGWLDPRVRAGTEEP